VNGGIKMNLDNYQNREEMTEHISDLISNFDVTQLDYDKVAEAAGCRYSKQDDAILIDMHETYLTPQKIEELESQYGFDLSIYLEDLFSIQDNELHKLAEEMTQTSRIPIYHFNDAFGILVKDIDFKFSFFCESDRVANLVVRDFFIDLEDTEFLQKIEEKLHNKFTPVQIIEDYFNENLELFVYQYVLISPLSKLVYAYYQVKDSLLQRIEERVKELLDQVKGHYS
jgi:phosphopantetheine adenylyltransferase